MSIELECLMGVTGIIRPEVTETTIERAVNLRESIKRRLAKWIAKPVLAPWTMPMANDKGEQPDPTKLREKLNHPSDFTAQLHDMHEATELQIMIADARAMMVVRWPQVIAKDSLDDTVFGPGEDEQQDWLAELAVIEDPRRLMDEIEAGALTPNLAKVFGLAYPEWYAELCEDAHTTIESIELEEAAEVIMQVFLQEPQVPGAPAPEPEAGEGPAPSAGTRLRSDAAKAPSERASP